MLCKVVNTHLFCFYEYCFNSYCPQPQNSIENNICFNCQSPLVLQNRYRGLKIIGQ